MVYDGGEAAEVNATVCRHSAAQTVGEGVRLTRDLFDHVVVEARLLHERYVADDGLQRERLLLLLRTAAT